MTTAAATLLMDMSDVARLAGVQRSVVSMWRSRSASTADPFPAPLGDEGGRLRFDAEEVADWLMRTGHGNNTSAREDTAAAAAPGGYTFANQNHVGELEALITLIALADVGEDNSPHELDVLAGEIDPDDRVLRREVAAHGRRGAPWTGFAARLIDAAYSPAEALAVVARRADSVGPASGSASRLTEPAVSLIIDMTRALLDEVGPSVILDPHDVELSVAIAAVLGDDATLTLPASSEARRLRRRLLAAGIPVSVASAPGAVTVARVPAEREDDAIAMLSSVEELALSMHDADAAIVVGPARALVDAVAPDAERIRADILRTGRVRAIVKLAPGLVTGAVREALAIWLLGAPQGGTPIAERLTAFADLTDRPLTAGTRGDLVSDLVTGFQGPREIRSRAFVFARFVRTASLQASRGSLLPPAPRVATTVDRATLPARLDIAAAAVRDDLRAFPTAPSSAPAPAPLPQVIADGHVRIISGIRIDPASLGDTGLTVLTAVELDGSAARIDQLTLAELHPSASLTRPGDVVFRTSPTAAAWVDREGSNVFAYPARVIRVNRSDPGGLVPEVIAADITGAASGPGAWKRWMLRRVSPQTIAPLRAALDEVEAARSALYARARRLEQYSALLVDGATTGAAAVISAPPAAPAASTR